MAKILSNKHIKDNIYLMEVEFNQPTKPGQFFMLKAWDLDPLLPRPISIYDVSDHSVKFLYAVVGKGTQILSSLKPFQELTLVGPLGNGFELSNKKVALVAGGIGIAPLLYLAKNLPIKPDLYVGFRHESYCLDEFRPYVNQIIVTTDDGHEGLHGFITSQINPQDYEVIYGCGPTPMMKVLNDLCVDTTLYLSLENHMACGIGACLGCTVQTHKTMERVCVDGPVFEAKELVNA